MKTRIGLRDLVTLLMVFGITVLASTSYWIFLGRNQEAQLQNARVRSELRARQLNEAVTQQLDATLRSVDIALKHLRTVYVHSPQTFDRAVRDVVATYPEGMIQFITIFDADGNLQYSSNQKSATAASPLQYFGDREHFRVHADAGAGSDKLFISAPIIGRIAGVPLIQITRGIWDGGRFLGVIGIPVRPDYLSDHLSSLRLDPVDLLVIVRLDGSVIARSHKLEDALKTKLPPDRPFFKGQAGDRGLFRSVSTFDKIPLLFSWQRLTDWPLITVAAINEDAEMAALTHSLTQERQQTLATITLILVFSLGLTLLLIRIQHNNAELSSGEKALRASETRFRTIFDEAPLGIALIDSLTGHIDAVNPMFARIAGRSIDEMAGIDWMGITHTDDIQPGLDNMARLNAGRINGFQMQKRYLHKDGTAVWIQMTIARVEGEDKSHPRHLCMVEDISERVRDAGKIDALMNAQKAILNNELVGIMTANARVIGWVNPAFEKLLGYEPGELPGLPVRLGYCSDEAYEAFGRQAYPVMQSGKSYRTEYEYQRKDGSKVFCDVSGSMLSAATGDALWCLIDVSERKRNEQEIRQLAFYDTLTALPNRRLLLDRLSQAMTANKRSERHGAVIFLDLDKFKTLNDTHGHGVGDLLLVEVADRLSGCVRQNDTVSRFGGDEFVVLLGDLASGKEESESVARVIAEKIRAKLAETYLLTVGQKSQAQSRVELQCSASVGVTVFANNQFSQDDILKSADTAMYRAKGAGGNTIRFCEGNPQP